MTRANAIRWFGTLVVLLLTGPMASSQSQSLKPDAHGFLIATLEDVKAAGRSVTVVGDSSKPGIYVQRITWAPNTGSRPHYHNEGRYITVIKGTWYVATGPEADLSPGTCQMPLITNVLPILKSDTPRVSL